MYREKEITKNVYNNIMNLIGRYNRKMNAIFMNSKNSKTPDPQRPILKLTDKINLKGIIGYYI